ncbi:acyl-CoA thioesterase [Sphingosinicella terrae]|uniref:acyl-CoA thioesterase n=1 Tax=Sphingosinicella terrae TaxID=2172047 RepID=UPI000E0DEE6A|nr:thioesterase family protein [Sphingosinicella terrae]
MSDSSPPAETLPGLIDALGATAEPCRIVVPDRWMQGRTVYGGLSAALALAATLGRWDDLPPLRSAQIAFVGPLAGALEIRTELLRRGRSAAFVQADVASAAGLGVRATFLFVAARESHVDLAADASGPETPPPMTEAFEPPPGVAFIRNFELRMTAEERDGQAHIARWARLLDRDGLHPMVELLAVGDVLPPAAMRLFTRPGPISSMNWHLNLLADPPATTDGWWLLRSTADQARHGYSGQQMSIRDAAGRLVATATQSVALFA